MTGVDEDSGPAFQEVRLAVTMVGGVSLAIWMGGVAREISHVVQASRGANGTRPASAGNGAGSGNGAGGTGGGGSADRAPETDQAEAIRACYGRLLRLLRVSVSVDVLTGTSAGGINAACLGVAEGYQSTLGDLRDVWLETGSFSRLLRDPDEVQPPSVLHGDKVMLSSLNQALSQIAAGGRGVPNPDITVLLTSTMVDGETTQFTDALGSRVRDTEHRLLFRFDGDYWKQGQSQAPLALAARSTASFPAAFELSRMPVDDKAQVDEMHPDSSPYTNAVSSHWLTDGGVLLNKPLGPALRAIFERPAGDDVRRLMFYVAPTGEEDVAQLPVDKTRPPLLGAALNRVVGAITSQTISAELEDLDRHNEAVVRTRGTRVSLARMGTKLGKGLVDEGIMTDYRRRRVQGDAAALVREAMRRLSQGRPTPWATGTDALLIDSAAAKLMSAIPSHLPSAEPGDEPGSFRYDELGSFRTTALEAAVGSGLQLVALGFRLDPSNEQARILNKARQSLHSSRSQARRVSSVASWVGDQLRTDLPSADRLATGNDLAGWISGLAQGWAAAGPDNEKVADEWRKLAQALLDVAPTLHEVNRDQPPTVHLPDDLAAAWQEDRRSLGYLTDYLLPSGGGLEQVCGRLLALHVAERGLLAAPPAVDQRVDLVQVSADTRSLLDPSRDLFGKKLTGIQVHNFGAFYKRSWRANDWMWGRVDGAGWLVHALLDPRRLRLLRDMTPDGPDGRPGRDIFASQVAETFARLGWVGAGDPDGNGAATPEAATLLREVEELGTALDEELAFLGLDRNLRPIDEARARSQGAQDSLPVSMPTTALVLSRGIQSIIAADELPVVAQAAAADVAAGADRSRVKGFLAQFPMATPSRSPATGPNLPPAVQPVAVFDSDKLSAQSMLRVQGLFRSCKIADEKFQTELGSQLMTRTIVQTAAVTVNAASAAGNIPNQVKPALTFFRSATRSAWWVTQGANSLPRPWSLAAGAVTALAGVVLAGTDNAVLQGLGLASLVGGVIFLLVSLSNLSKTWKRVVTVLGGAVVALFLFAAFIPWIRSWWFDWLGGLAASWKAGQQAWVWFAVAAFILLPAIATVVQAVPRPFRKRRLRT